jgi:hypothetical protein
MKIPMEDFAQETVTIDGIGKISLPLQLKARRGLLSALSFEIQNSIMRTADPKRKSSEEAELSIILLEDVDSLGAQVEQWALEYTSKFVHAAGPNFHSTTIAHILGEAYVKKGLPEVCEPQDISMIFITDLNIVRFSCEYGSSCVLGICFTSWREI